MTEASVKVAPEGKQSSFASRAYASYVLAEKGDQQPRSLAVAFLAPARGPDFVAEGISALRRSREQMDKAYGACAADKKEMDVAGGKGTLRDILEFVAGGKATGFGSELAGLRFSLHWRVNPESLRRLFDRVPGPGALQEPEGPPALPIGGDVQGRALAGRYQLKTTALRVGQSGQVPSRSEIPRCPGRWCLQRWPAQSRKLGAPEN